jgi:hypothetical protein
MIRRGPLVGLTRYSLARDQETRIWHPVIDDDPGTIHAIRPTTTEPALTDPYFIEHTQDYRAAICGALIKVILPLSFKTTEAGACTECIEEIQQPSKPDPWLRDPFFTATFGESWSHDGSYKNPGWVRRRADERAKREAETT